jgi:hypothetical protein
MGGCSSQCLPLILTCSSVCNASVPLGPCHVLVYLFEHGLIICSMLSIQLILGSKNNNNLLLLKVSFESKVRASLTTPHQLLPP